MVAFTGERLSCPAARIPSFTQEIWLGYGGNTGPRVAGGVGVGAGAGAGAGAGGGGAKRPGRT